MLREINTFLQLDISSYLSPSVGRHLEWQYVILILADFPGKQVPSTNLLRATASHGISESHLVNLLITVCSTGLKLAGEVLCNWRMLQLLNGKKDASSLYRAREKASVFMRQGSSAR